MLKIHETTRADGTLGEIFLSHHEGALAIVIEGEALALPEGAIEAVMAKFGAPLEPGERLGEIAALDLGEGRRVRHVRHLARYDVIARDWLVLEQPGHEALCAMATTVAGALEHLARAALAR
ncbi:MAG: hypothetical protein JST00_25250 [Deltaproteobacteria bacterium]|nr:hypothetical protein [Deltaproteobacteria bacterium]